jgi:hypothetical protein
MRKKVIFVAMALFCAFTLSFALSSDNAEAIETFPVQFNDVELTATSIATHKVIQAGENAIVEQCYVSNYNRLGSFFAQPATYFYLDASHEELLFSVSVNNSVIPEGKLYYVLLVYNTSTSTLETYTLGGNAQQLEPEFCYTYLLSVWELGIPLEMGTRYAINIYLYPLVGDALQLNPNTWHSFTFIY